DRLRATGLYESSVVIFLSDHGEEFFDHRGWGHGRTLYQEQLRVPLIVRFPGADAPRGRRISGLGQQVDLLPTLLDYLGLPPLEGIQGSSLLPVVFGAERTPPSGYSLLELDGRFAESLVEGRWKLLCGNHLGVACNLYDLADDPGERIDLAARRPVAAGYLQSRMRGFRNPDDRLQAAEAQLDPELRERLEALGYVEPDPSPVYSRGHE
ncbi:MAG: sulfatase-like hydrolase/transferase, partial [bacterium]|nr:sulfatase-like hydrolase/transferase [bacterium]